MKTYAEYTKQLQEKMNHLPYIKFAFGNYQTQAVFNSWGLTYPDDLDKVTTIYGAGDIIQKKDIPDYIAWKKETLLPLNDLFNELTYVDNTKSETSKRILPLFDDTKEYLQTLKLRQEKEKLAHKNYVDSDYICRWEDGHLITPDYISRNFKKFLQKNNMPEIRFHDLRHSVASMMVQSEIPIERIKNWLGHSTVSTTEIYIHLNFNANLQTKTAMEQALSIAMWVNIVRITPQFYA